MATSRGHGPKRLIIFISPHWRACAQTDVIKVEPVMKELGKTFGKNSAAVKEGLLAMADDAKLAMMAKHEAGETATLTTCDGSFDILPAYVTIKKAKQKVSGKTFTPGAPHPPLPGRPQGVRKSKSISLP